MLCSSSKKLWNLTMCGWSSERCSCISRIICKRIHTSNHVNHDLNHQLTNTLPLCVKWANIQTSFQCQCQDFQHQRNYCHYILGMKHVIHGIHNLNTFSLFSLTFSRTLQDRRGPWKEKILELLFYKPDALPITQLTSCAEAATIYPRPSPRGLPLCQFWSS